MSPASWARPGAVLVGVSTGGPDALARLLPQLPASFPLPVLVVQHMPVGFTASLAERLDALSRLAVREARSGQRLRPGEVLIAPGGSHLALTRGPTGITTVLNQAPAENSCRPAVDVLLRTAAAALGAPALVVILTGMGHDGRRGALPCRERGGYVLCQDEATSVVWGMPGSVVGAGLADEVVPLGAMAARIDELARLGWPLVRGPGVSPTPSSRLAGG